MATELTASHTATSLPARIQSGLTPALFAGSRKTEKRFWEFFAVTIRNKNTRQAYLTAAFRFADWCEAKSIDLIDVEPMVVAAYIEQLTAILAPATVKQHLAAIRMLFDWLVIGQVVAMNPASAVRGPKHIVKRGKTPVLEADDTRMLLDTIDTETLVGLRDRALIAVMIYTFARVSAAVALNVGDYYIQGKRSFVRLQEKGGKYQAVPAHHTLIEYLDAYIAAADIAEDRKGPLFRSSGRGRQQNVLGLNRMSRHTSLQMIKRRVAEIGLPDAISNHSFRGTGITDYLRNGGTLEKAAQIANHESTRTTQLYDRTDDELTLDEIERIHI